MLKKINLTLLGIALALAMLCGGLKLYYHFNDVSKLPIIQQLENGF